MTPTLVEARADLFGVLDVGLAGIDAAYDHEPGREATGPVYLTIGLPRVTPTAQEWPVRIYSQMADSPEDATTALYEAVAVVDDCLGEAQLGPSEWDFAVVDEIEALVARTTVSMMRETY